MSKAKSINIFNYNYLYTFLLNNNITQVWLANQLETEDSHVNKWLAGKNSPSLYYTAKISKILDIPIENLIIKGDQI